MVQELTCRLWPLQGEKLVVGSTVAVELENDELSFMLFRVMSEAYTATEVVDKSKCWMGSVEVDPPDGSGPDRVFIGRAFAPLHEGGNVYVLTEAQYYVQTEDVRVLGVHVDPCRGCSLPDPEPDVAAARSTRRSDPSQKIWPGRPTIPPGSEKFRVKLDSDEKDRILRMMPG